MKGATTLGMYFFVICFDQQFIIKLIFFIVWIVLLAILSTALGSFFCCGSKDDSEKPTKPKKMSWVEKLSYRDFGPFMTRKLLEDLNSMDWKTIEAIINNNELLIHEQVSNKTHKMNRCLDKWSIGSFFFQSWGYIIALLDGLSKIDWERVNTVIHNEKNIGDKRKMEEKYGVNVDYLIKQTERMCEIDWNSFYTAFGNWWWFFLDFIHEYVVKRDICFFSFE